MNNNASENGGERRRSARLAELRGPDCSLSDVTISSACGSDIAAEDKLDHEVDTSVENQDSGDNNSNNISAIKRMEPRRAKRFISSSPVAGLTGATSSEIPTSFLSPSGPIKKRIRVLGELDHNAVLGLPLNSNRHVDFLVTPSPRKVAAGRLPGSVVDLSEARTRLCPVRPSPVDDNTVFVAKYGNDYYSTLLSSDRMTENNEIYYEDTSDGQWMDVKLSYLRFALIDWLARDVAQRFRLSNETLHITVGLLDRFLEQEVVERRLIQCLGCACMLIAAKLEEEHFPSIEEMNLAVSCATHRSEEFNDFAQARFTKKDYVRMEARICNVLKFKLQGINMYHFMDRFLQASTAGDGHYWPSFPNETLDSLVSYYLDLALMEYDFSRSFRSQIVASAIFLARLVLGLRARNGKLWSESLQYYTGYCMSELEDCVIKLRDLQSVASEKFPSIFAKYCHTAYREVAFKAAPLREDLLNVFE